MGRDFPFTALKLSAVNPWLVRLAEEPDCTVDLCSVVSYDFLFTAMELSIAKPWLVKPAKESGSNRGSGSLLQFSLHRVGVVTHNSLSSHNRVPMISHVVCTLFYHPGSSRTQFTLHTT